jgi:hypothetical protein
MPDEVSFHLDDHYVVVVERRDGPRAVDLLEARYREDRFTFWFM